MVTIILPECKKKYTYKWTPGIITKKEVAIYEPPHPANPTASAVNILGRREHLLPTCEELYPEYYM